MSWQRSEAIRRDEIERQKAQAILEWERAQAREFWALILAAQRGVEDRIRGDSAGMAGARSPSELAGNAYAVALLGLPELATLARDYYRSLAKLEWGFARQDDTRVMADIPAWSKAFRELEAAMMALSQHRKQGGD